MRSPSALESELELHVASLRRYARALLRDPWDAEDLVQETLARALSRSRQFQPGTNLRAWLFAILHSLRVNRIRQAAARPGEVSVESVEGRLSSPPTQESRVELQDVARALDELPIEQKQVLLLVALEGLKYEDVAQILEIPVGTVMSRLSRGREALRSRLSHDGRSPLRRVK